MKNIKLKNKKIGIWGLGIVGQSALDYIQQYTNKIQILDKQRRDHPAFIQQTEKSTLQFLQDNDLIIASPGIPLHNYQDYKHKFISELDLYQQKFKGKTIAITGTLGKTSITTLLQQCTPNSIAAGNIGNAMLNAIKQNPQPPTVILELSSFQLHYADSFEPNISIWTNFYPNHLDHHQSEEEYFLAKCNILKHQSKNQITLLPCNLVDRIAKSIKISAQVYSFCTCSADKSCSFLINASKNQMFYIQNNNISLNTKIIFQNLNQLPTTTYQQNWLIIIAALYLQNIPAENVLQLLSKPQEHRLEKIGVFNGSTFYNDSKSTVWQATKQAIKSLGYESCTLFLGGLSKGTDRTPLIKYLENKNIKVVAFGAEAQLIKKLCDQHNLSCSAHTTLDNAFYYMMNNKLSKNILFSPAGASFDLFKNYIDRGKTFKELLSIFLNKLKTNNC